MGECGGFCLSSAVNSMVLPSKSGNGQFDVLISHEDTILCNEGDSYKSHPEVKPMRTRSEKEKEHWMMHWSFCKIGNCPAHYDMPTFGRQMSADEYYSQDGEPVWEKRTPARPRQDVKLHQSELDVKLGQKALADKSGARSNLKTSDAVSQGKGGPEPKEGLAPSERPRITNKSRYMPVDPKGLGTASQSKKQTDMVASATRISDTEWRYPTRSELADPEEGPTEMESRDSSGPCSSAEELPAKTEIALEWRNSWQRRFRGNMATLNTPMWIATRLLEEEPAVSIGLLKIWTHPSKLKEATHQRVQEINRMSDREAFAKLDDMQQPKYVKLAGNSGKLTVGIQLSTPSRPEKINVAALLDSGCDGSSIDHRFVLRNKILTRQYRIR